MAVTGAGPLGHELAQAFAGLGVEVVIFEQDDRAGGVHNPVVHVELVRILRESLTIHFGVEVTLRLEGDDVVMSWDGELKRFDRVLVATGRGLQMDDLASDRPGLALRDDGVPCYDKRTMQYGTAPVFIAGNVNADRPVLHEPSDEGTIAGRNAARFPDVEPMDRDLPFTVTFTDPPVAIVGETASEASVIGCAPYADQGRARVMAEAKGLVRLYAAKPDGRLTGGAMIGPGMDHIAHLLALAIMRGETATSLLKLPFYHPTLKEGLKTGLRAICHEVHSPLPDRDRGNPPGS